ARAEMRAARDALERAQFKADAEAQQLRAEAAARDERLAQAQALLEAAREKSDGLAAAARDADEARVAALRQVAGLEARVQSHAELVARAAKADGGALLHVQLQDARSQLEALQSEVQTTAERAEDYRQLAAASEQSLAQLSETYDQYKADRERGEAERRQAALRLERELADARDALDTCRRELEAAAKAEKALREAEASGAGRVRQLEGALEQRDAALEALRQDMARHEGVTQSVQEQYEREIVAHAKDIEATLLAREKLRDSQRALAAVTADLQASRLAAEQTQADSARASERAAADVQAAEAQLAKLRRQNALLLAHLESIGHQVPDVS
ncbi:hypothetical protein IWW38_006276, partial [Coemansia aciculifera]